LKGRVVCAAAGATPRPIIDAARPANKANLIIVRGEDIPIRSGL
jgi:hypothetical protein